MSLSQEPAAKSRRGYRRNDGPQGRVLALFDTIGIRKRAVRTHVTLSTEGYDELMARAQKAGITAAGLAAFIVETAVRKEPT